MQSDVLQAGDKVLPVRFDSSSAAGEDLPDTVMSNPGPMTAAPGARVLSQLS